MTVAACGLKIDGLPLACGGDWLGKDGACDCMGKLCEHQISVEEARIHGWIRLERIERDGVHNRIVYVGRAPDTGGASFRVPCDVLKNAIVKINGGKIVEISKGGKILWPVPVKPAKVKYKRRKSCRPTR